MAATAIIGAMTAALPAIKDALGRVLSDKDQINELAHEIKDKTLDALQKTDIAQTEVNLADARSGNLWQAGWRPAAGWACVVLFTLSHGGPIIAALAGFPEIGREITSYENTTDGLLYGLLGLTTYRTVERGMGKLA